VDQPEFRSIAEQEQVLRRCEPPVRLQLLCFSLASSWFSPAR
jgi:hypothetical protein